ncbi:hypothetical protein SEA_NEDARYA_87 [Gordonia phage Nedarya]|nr:hypothetical protein SEA_NEDARYA_87 [Gordonia phage Nedarya]
MALILSILIAFFPAIADDVPAPFVEALPACVEEDGNPDGTPCIWEGKYYNDSSVYR